MPSDQTPDATPNVVLADRIARIIAGFGPPSEQAGPATQFEWKRAKEKTERILAALRTDKQEGEGITASEVRSELLDEVTEWGSQKALAKRIGVSPSFLCDVLLQRREPGPKIAEYLGRKQITLYAFPTPPTNGEGL